MNVLITNEQEAILSELNIEIIKTLRGDYEAEEIINMFANFFFARMILDITAIRNYDDISNLQKISIALPVDKIILFVPGNTKYSENAYLSKLISMGYYNFTTNVEGVNYLLETPNTYKDVAHLHQLETTVIHVPGPTSPGAMPSPKMEPVAGETKPEPQVPTIRVIGFKNVTDGAGATTLIFTIKKELEKYHNMKVKAIEISKRDFIYFHDKSLVSINKNDYNRELSLSGEADLILVDMNDMNEEMFEEVVYLIEPSIIKINKLVRRDQKCFEKLKDKKIVLNKSMISNDEIKEFSNEANISVFAAIRPFNDRNEEEVLNSFLNRMEIIKTVNNDRNSAKTESRGGLFKK